MSTFNLELALEARDEGIRRVAANNEQFLNVARAIARQLASERGAITMDDVRASCHLEPLHYNAWGAVFKHKDFQATGEYRKSALVHGHGNRQMVWGLKKENPATGPGSQ